MVLCLAGHPVLSIGGNARRQGLKTTFALLCPRSPGLGYLIVDSLITEPARGIPGIRSIVEKRVQLYRDFRTTIHQMIGEGDLVATRETHKGIHRGDFPTPIGTFDVTGRPIEWTSQVSFRFVSGKISEMWVARDELGILRYLGIVLEARQ
jgi:predicted ester cyclase